MKQLIIVIVFAGTCILSAQAKAQQIREGAVRFMKDQQTAQIGEYAFPKDIIEEALKERLAKIGLSNRGSFKGYTSYKGTIWKELSSDKLDVYTRVEGKDNNSTLIILVSKGYDNFIDAANDPEMVERVRSFMREFSNDALLYNLRLNIAAQETILNKAEREYKNKVEDGEKLVKEKSRIEKEMTDNTNAQAKQQEMVTQERIKLDELKRKLQGS